MDGSCFFSSGRRFRPHGIICRRLASIFSPGLCAQRLQYEILHLQHEKRALEKELVAVKSTVAALTEKLGKAGERLKKQQVAF